MGLILVCGRCRGVVVVVGGGVIHREFASVVMSVKWRADISPSYVGCNRGWVILW